MIDTSAYRSAVVPLILGRYALITCQPDTQEGRAEYDRLLIIKVSSLLCMIRYLVMLDTRSVGHRL
jgi:hypothetical protein